MVVLTNCTESVDDIGIRLLDKDFNLPKKNPSITLLLQQKIDSEGLEAAIAAFQKAKNDKSHLINETAINSFGYTYMTKEDYKTAMGIFKLNIDEFPNSSNAYDSYAEALMKNGDNEEAIENYKKSFELNPGNSNAAEMLKKLGADVDIKEVEVTETTMDLYVGKYQLAPSFFVEISREGKQLMAQATGQANFPVFPKSENEFYYKVVEATIEFKVVDGKTESLILHQGGQHIPGKKVD